MDPELLFRGFTATLSSMMTVTRVVFVVLHPDDFEVLRQWSDFNPFDDENPERLETPMGGQPRGLFRGIWVCTTPWISPGTMIPYPELEAQAVRIGGRFDASRMQHRIEEARFVPPPPPDPGLPSPPLATGPWGGSYPGIGIGAINPRGVHRLRVENTPAEPATPIERPTVWEHLEDES